MTPHQMILIAGWAFEGTALRALGVLLDQTRTVSLTSGIDHVAAGAQPSLAGLAGLLDASQGAVVLVGWSLGAMLAIEAAAAFPEKIAALVLISGTARFCAAPEHQGVAPAVLRAMKVGFKRNPQSVLRAFYAQCAAPHAEHISGADERHWTACLPSEQARHKLLNGLFYLESADLRNILPQLNLPVLVLHGRADMIVPWQAGAQLAKCLPCGNWKLFDGVGHDLPLRFPELVAAEIEAFLKGLA